MKHEEGHLVGFPIQKGLTYRKRKGHEYCVVIATVYGKHDMCEYIAANTTEEVFSRDTTFAAFIKEFEPTQLGLNEVLTMLKNRAARVGATERAQYLLDFLIAQIEEGEVSMATKKKAATAAATPKATKAAAPKATKAAAAEPSTKRGRPGQYADSMKIKLLVKENPKRAGSASATRFDFYKTSKTVADYVAAGGAAADLRWDVEKGYIEVA